MAVFLIFCFLISTSSASVELPTLILSEMCYYNFSDDFLDHTLPNVSIILQQKMCEQDNILKLIPTLSQQLIMGSLDASLCLPAHYMANFYNATLITWNCPQDAMETEAFLDHSKMRISPSVAHISATLTGIIFEMRWKSVAIISSKTGWWPTLAQFMDSELREGGIIPKHSIMLSHDISYDQIVHRLQLLAVNPCRVIILCMPADRLGRKVIQLIDELQLSTTYNSLVMLVDVSTLPSWRAHLTHAGDSPSNATPSMHVPSEITPKLYNDLLLMAEVNDAENCNVSFTLDSLETLVLAKTRETLAVATNGNYVRATPVFALFSWHENGSWLPLLVATNRTTLCHISEHFNEWSWRHELADECLNCQSEYERVIGAIVILGCASILVAILVGVGALARNQLLKKKLSKGPYKVLLTATDFVFPQLPDSRRVDEGIEAMLCCWLQQLQEFGGPEVEKPDLLQSSAGSIRTPLRANSSPNLAKQLIVDPRVRYNGDLVQMKPLPPGTVELKAKTVEVLVMLHGLRHENVNPLIGCLAEPPRAALVAEWCSRGSLQDVLQQDEIKLDWSFRLSLLTDLVRGMKYLHSTPIRVHGCLTSRNCVIDARWVLKITDYGLPAFYDAQGIPPPQKSARDLLWTAPELLRHTGLRKKGSQPGDVYSFGIICQEVVVRGEPFCMFALTPEEIIEKVKRPPPLIRPSVSKGAAPPEAINIMRQCWAEQPDLRPDFGAVHDLFKKLNHGRKVNIVDTMFQMLEKYSNNLEELIRERTEQLDIEKKKTEQLLNRMLPSSVAEKLKLGMPVDPEEFEQVTIYFSDIVGFTTISAHSTPFQVVDLLNDLYTCFDATINAYNVYKVETIGDAYMVVGGLPVRIPDHAEQIATMALDLLHQSGRFCIRHLPATPLRLRIGLHTGPCCAGVVGLTMPRYCLFGDTVNTASRMESTGSAWRIHLSEATKERLERAGGYQLEYRGLTDVKGKGVMHTYWLLGKSGFNKNLPTPPSIDIDESLLICNDIRIQTETQQPLSCLTDIRVLHDDSPAIDLPINAAKSPSTDPTFMKTMETSKFSSLMKNTDKPEHHMVKSTSSDTPMSMGTPVSATEVAAALLAVSNNSLSGFRGRHRSRIQEEDDLSTPYNHYKCLSPKERAGKLLRRQFSLDRAEEGHESPQKHESPKLCKQSSLGAADLEKIEEAPCITPSPSLSPYHCTLSISADSLLH